MIKSLRFKLVSGGILLSGSFIFAASAATIVVPGTADPWLAGMPAGSQDNVGTPQPPDVAPAQSAVLGVPVAGGTVITWSAAGTVGHPEDPGGPDGSTSLGSLTVRAAGPNNGMSQLISPFDSLIGVFLGPSQPDLNPTPATLDFSTAASRDYSSLFPQLQQVFFMGDGLTSGSLRQTIIAPAGATRLFLGTMDSYGWANNIGEFDVTIEIGGMQVPDSTPYCWLALVGLLVSSTVHRRFTMNSAIERPALKQNSDL